MNDEPVSSSSGMTSATLSDDALPDLETPNCEIFKSYAEKHDVDHEDSTRNAVDLEDISMGYTETSNDEDISEQLSTDIERPANQLRLVTNAKSSVDYTNESAYSIINF